MKKIKQNLFEFSHILLLKTFLLGVLLAEIFILSKVTGDVFVEKTIIDQRENWDSVQLSSQK